MDYKQMWDKVLVEIELAISKATFITWFSNTHIQKIDDGTVYLHVPNVFAKDWISNKYHKQILKNLRGQNDSIRAMTYIIAKEDGSKKRVEEAPKAAFNPTPQLPLNDVQINKEDNLNPRYTFDTLIVGSFNELAHAASQAIIKKPGQAYNPFFIYGNTGHGKTHLVQSIGNYIKAHYPGKKVYYLTSEKFGQECINALQTNKMNLFKEKYRKYDLIIMDDVQFFSNKDKIQEELFHLFNFFFDNNRQIIFSADKHPNFIANVEDRLRSRFSSGMLVELPYPDLESRTAILKAKASQSGFTLNDEVAEYLASSVEGNIRELEGALNSIICQAQLKGKELSMLEIKNLVKNSAKPKKTIAAKDIIKVIADYYNIDEASIYDKTRRKEVVRPRQMVMYILREDCSVSYPSIGQKLGGRDHTTVIHSCEKIKHEIKTDPALMQELNQIRALL